MKTIENQHLDSVCYVLSGAALTINGCDITGPLGVAGRWSPPLVGCTFISEPVSLQIQADPKDYSEVVTLKGSKFQRARFFLESRLGWLPFVHRRTFLTMSYCRFVNGANGPAVTIRPAAVTDLGT